MATSLHLHLLLWILYSFSLSQAFWFYGYDDIFRDPNPETTNNEIAKTRVVTYLASQKNTAITAMFSAHDEFQHDYTYKLMMFESIVQYRTDEPKKEWNLGVWDSFVYCNPEENAVDQGLCLSFTDGTMCDTGNYRQTMIRLTCDKTGDKTLLYDVEEASKCVYTAKLYIPEICGVDAYGIPQKKNLFYRTPHEAEELTAVSYISNRGNLKNTLPYTELSATHDIGVEMKIDEVNDDVILTLHGPSDKYFAIGFGSNSMADTYAIVVSGKHHGQDWTPMFWEQKLDKHGEGEQLEPSFYLKNHVHVDGMHKVVLTRKLSTALELDQYWLFSCADPEMDIIWSVGESSNFERHVAFGEDHVTFDVKKDSSYDKRDVDLGQRDYSVHINWAGVFIAVFFLSLTAYVVWRYKWQLYTLGKGMMTRWQESGLSGFQTSLRSQSTQYGSAVDQAEPLMNGADGL